MTDEENLTDKTSTIVTYPIAAALMEAEEFVIDSSGWNPVKIIQRDFLERFYTPCREEIPTIKEIKRIAHFDVEVVNKWLKEHDFDIQLDSFDENGFGAAGMIDLLGLWLVKGRQASIATDNGGKYPGVRMDTGFTFNTVGGSSDLVVALETGDQDVVYMMMDEKVPSGFSMVSYVEEILQNMTPVERDYEAVVFPMIDLNEEGELEWLINLQLMIPQDRFPFYFIQQALQQTKLKMNQEGYRIKSVAAAAMMLGAALPETPPYIINRPFLMWIMRPGLSRPLFVAYLNTDVWKDPSGLEM
ncbi:MAG: hypothetical protein ACXABV_07195 [Candidatus Thorarchaeota archaeon]|jgi:hypothetical protein